MKNVIFYSHRELRGMTQQQVADKVGVCKDYINMIENNRRSPSFALAKRVADLFATTVDELFFYSVSERNIQRLQKNVHKIIETYTGRMS